MSGSAENKVDNFSFETNEEEKSCERTRCKQVSDEDAQNYLNQSSVLSGQYTKCTRGNSNETDDIESDFLSKINKHESDGKRYLCNDHQDKSEVYIYEIYI